MLTDYENEQNELNKIIETDTADMQRIIGGQNNVERFLKLVKKYENITELTPAMINEFIDKILVHEPQGKGADRTTEVEIYLNYVGQFQVPVEQHEPTEEERIAAEKKILVHEPQGKGADRTTEVEIYLNYVGQFQVPVEQHEPTEEERIAAEKEILVHEPQGKGADRTTEVEIYLNYVGQFQVPVEQHEPTEEERIAAEKEADRLRRKRESNRKYMKKIREKSKLRSMSV